MRRGWLRRQHNLGPRIVSGEIRHGIFRMLSVNPCAFGFKFRTVAVPTGMIIRVTADAKEGAERVAIVSAVVLSTGSTSIP
jgi:hypothetical protein